MVGKSSDVQIQIRPNLQIQLQIRSFKKLKSNPNPTFSEIVKIQIHPSGKSSNPNPPYQKSSNPIQIHRIWQKSLNPDLNRNPDLDLPTIGFKGNVYQKGLIGLFKVVNL